MLEKERDAAVVLFPGNLQVKLVAKCVAEHEAA
jgi:hypothetical protein